MSMDFISACSWLLHDNTSGRSYTYIYEYNIHIILDYRYTYMRTYHANESISLSTVYTKQKEEQHMQKGFRSEPQRSGSQGRMQATNPGRGSLMRLLEASIGLIRTLIHSKSLVRILDQNS